jgi:hypothetical protein
METLPRGQAFPELRLLYRKFAHSVLEISFSEVEIEVIV